MTYLGDRKVCLGDEGKETNYKKLYSKQFLNVLRTLYEDFPMTASSLFN